MKKKEKALLTGWVMLAVLTGLFYLLRPYQDAADWVVNHISAPIRESLGRVTSVFPFSLAEFFYVLVVILFLWLLLRLIREVIKNPGWKKKVQVSMMRIAAMTLIPAMIWTGYNWLWAIGYYGNSFGEKSGLVSTGVTVEELTKVTQYFAEQAGDYSQRVARDEEGHFAESGFFQDTQGLYEAMEEEFPLLKQKMLRPKPMLFSKFMSLIGFTGFYFPFTGEANVNVDFPPALQPETIAHEMAHQRRVNSEAEANFVGITACVTSGRTVYAYSGYLSGLTHLGNALSGVDREAWLAIRETLPEEVLQDWRDNSAYWAKFESPVETAATTVYDSYLKHNQQEAGIQSYGQCVDLLVEYFKGKC